MLKRKKAISILILSALIASNVPSKIAFAEVNNKKVERSTQQVLENKNNKSEENKSQENKNQQNSLEQNKSEENKTEQNKDEQNQNAKPTDSENNKNDKEDANQSFIYIKDPNKAVEVKGNWVNKDNKWYFHTENGQPYKGWILNKGQKYYLDKETGIMQLGWFKIDGKWYFAEDSGAMKKGWQLYKNSWYFIHDGGEMATGFINDGGKRYYLNADGIMASNWFRIDGKWYFAEDSGAMKKGWQLYKNSWYFIHDTGEMATGFINDGGKRYYLNADGIMQTGTFVVDGKTYVADENGAIKEQKPEEKPDENKEGQWVKKDNKWYYVRDGKNVTGWLNDKGTWYYLNNTGEMLTGEITVGSKQYYMNSSGVMQNFQYINNKYYGKDGARKNFDKGDRIIVVIDPGHNYGGDQGASATHHGITYIETDLNMQVAVKLKAKLQELGFDVRMTREASERPIEGLRESLRKRADYANGLNTDFFISIHQDSFTNSNATGVTAFYSSHRPNLENDGLISNGDNGYIDTTPTTAAQVSAKFSNNVIKSVSSEMNFYNRGSKDNNLYVTKNTTMPSVLLEGGFITNSNEAKKIADPQNQQKYANIIARELTKIFPVR